MRKNIMCVILAGIMTALVLMTGCTADKAAGDQTGVTGENDVTAETAGDVAGNTVGADNDGAAAGSAEPSPETAKPENTPASSWTMVYDLKITHPINVAGFLNEKFAITGGPNGEIHYSSDGGQTWPEAENDSMCRFCIDIVDENLIWSGGNGNNVRLSRDGGKTWQAASDISMGSMHSNIDFIDDTTGWIATTKELAVTKDGGATWTKLALPEGANSVAAVCLRTADDGYLLSHNGLLFKTTDGGTTWSSTDLGMKDYEVLNTKKQPGLDKKDIALADISFSDENNGIIVFTGASPEKGPKTWCLTTVDGGATWLPELLTLAEGYSATRVFASGDCKYITLGSYNDRFLLMKKNDI